MVFFEKGFPHADKVLRGIEDAELLPQPNVKTDGMLPFMISRLKNNEKAIEDADHQIRFAVARGPLNIASFLMGTTEFMLALTMDPDGSHKLLKKITDFICDWLSWQKECFPSIDGVLILDDIIGFVGEPEFQEFVHPYLKRIFSVTGAKARFLHNDADGLNYSQEPRGDWNKHVQFLIQSFDGRDKGTGRTKRYISRKYSGQGCSWIRHHRTG